MDLPINQIIEGSALEQLKKLPDECVDCCVTSPPYFNVRDYGVQGQIGLEPYVAHYLSKLHDIFLEVRRVLKKQGSCWVVLGDTYNNPKQGNTNGTGKTGKVKQKRGVNDFGFIKVADEGIPIKSTMLIPERFAIMMVDWDKWILRNKIIWHKPNSMPQSAKDRFSVDWEYLFFFTKSRKYFFDTQYEPYKTPQKQMASYLKIDYTGQAIKKYDSARAQNPSDAKRRIIASMRGGPKIGGNKAPGYGSGTYSGNTWRPVVGRIKRSVWSITTRGFAGAHFAVYPEELIETPIRSSCPVGGICLDPFIGSGTTGVVALKMGRRFVGIELNQEYIDIAQKRLKPLLEQTKLPTTVMT